MSINEVKRAKKSWDIYNNDINVETVAGSYYHEQDYLKRKNAGIQEEGNDEYWGFRCFVYPTGPDSERIWWDITDGIAEITWNEDLDSVAMECNLKVWDSTDLTGSRRLTEVMKKGAKISLWVKDLDVGKLKPIQSFVIWEITKNSSEDPYVEYNCFDPLVYLLKSEDNFLFTKSTSPGKKGWTADKITRDICQKYGVPIGFIPKASYKIPYFRVDNGSVWDVILKAWTEERKQTSVRYVLRMENGKFFIRPKQTKRTFWGVVEGENLINMSFTDSLEEMATAVRAISPKQQSSGSVSSSNPVRGGGELPEEKLEDLGGQRPTSEKDDKTRSVTSDVSSSWRLATASAFDPGKEKALAYGDAPSSTLKGFAELSSNPGDSGGWDWSALGGLPAYTKIDVKYKNKIITVPKIDVGRGGGPASGSSAPRGIDLTVASMRELTGHPYNLIEVEWRVHNQSMGAVEYNPGGDNVSAPGEDFVAVRKDAVQTYGYLQKLITTDPGVKESTLKKMAFNALTEAGRDNYDAELETYLLPFVRAGDPIYVRDSGTGLRGRYYCSDVSHSMSASGCRTKIGLNWLDIVPSLEMSKQDKAPPQPPSSPGGSSMPGSVVGGKLPTQAGCGPVPGGSWGGGPGIGTHSFSAPPDNWESDNAYDIFAPDGTPVISVDTAVVTSISEFRSDPRFWGHGVHIRCQDGTEVYYKHMKSLADGIRVGRRLDPRDIIGYLGTGVNGGPHLHFGVKPPANPDKYRNAACGGALPGTKEAIKTAGQRSSYVMFSVVPYGGQEKDPTVYLRDNDVVKPGEWVMLYINKDKSIVCRVKTLPKSADKKYGGVVSQKTLKRAIPTLIYPNKSIDSVMFIVAVDAVTGMATGVASDINDIADGLKGSF